MRNVTADFINTEIDLAETFCAVAGNASSWQKAQRNREHAQRALSSVLHFLSRVSLDEGDRAAILRRVARLENLLNDSSPRSIATEHA